MEIAVDLHLVVFGFISALAVICGLVHLALRNGSALAWLAATMACVATETLVLRYASQSALGVAAIGILVPSAYLCAAQAIRLSTGLPVTNGRLLVPFAALIGLSLLLLAAGAPPLVQCLPFQLAGVVVFLDATLALARQGNRGLLGNALLVVCCLSLAGIAIRAPMFPLLLGQPTPFPIMGTETFERVVMNGLGALTAGLALLVVARIVAREIDVHRHRSERDGLTGLLNRRTFDQLVDEPAAASGTVVMCDIDHFKTINDRFGHHVGDDVIRSFAGLLGDRVDHAGRVGGEEFALLLFGVGPQGAAAEADAIRRGFHAFRHPAMGEAPALSASFGIAAFDAGLPVRSAMERADGALYAAKQAGRNRVCVAPAETPARTPGQRPAQARERPENQAAASLLRGSKNGFSTT